MIRKIFPILTFIWLWASAVVGQPSLPPATFDIAAETTVAPLLQQAQASVGRGDFKAAIRLLEQALQQQGQHKAARKALIQLLMRQARTHEAETHITTFARLYPEDTDPTFLRAALAFQNGQLPQAASFAQQCLERGDKRAEVYKLLAICEYLQQ